MKKVSKVLCLFCFIFLLVGCSNFNKSPEAVSEEMVKRMSAGDYENISELLYLEENAFVDSFSFENYLNDNYINIEGNKNYEITDVEEVGNYTYVYVRLDNNNGLKIKTINKDGKWYIDLGDEFDENLIIKVPVGSTVKLNNTTLDREKYSKVQQDSLRHNYDYSASFDVDVYTIPYILSGDYILTVEKENAKTFTAEIESDVYYIYDVDNFANRNGEYLIKMQPTEELKTSVQTYINDLYTQMFNSINSNTDFNIIDSLDEEKDDYNELLEEKEEIGSYSETIHSDFRLNDVNLIEEYYYGDNSILIKYEIEYIYHYKFTYTNFMASMGDTFNEDKDVTGTLNGVIQLEKNNDSFIIKTGYNIIPNI